VTTPLLDHDARFLQAVENFQVQAFVAELPVETLAIAVPPGTARLDVKWARPQTGKPLSKRFGDHFGAIIAADMIGNAPRQHDVSQRLDDPECIDAPRDAQRQTFPAELVDQRKDPDAPTVMCGCLDKVEAPHMVRALRPQTDA